MILPYVDHAVTLSSHWSFAKTSVSPKENSLEVSKMYRATILHMLLAD